MTEFEYYLNKTAEQMEQIAELSGEIVEILRELNEEVGRLEIYVQNTADTSEQ